MNRLCVAVGGSLYPIDRYIPKEYVAYRPIQARAIQNAVQSHDGPITLLGFSFGAEVVLRTAIACPNSKIDRVIAHSPGKGVLKGGTSLGPVGCAYTFLATNGDTLCEAETRFLYEKFSNDRITVFKSFDYITEPGQSFVAKFMRKHKHQFVNAIPYLESVGWYMS